jgi:hypothetical protein
LLGQDRKGVQVAVGNPAHDGEDKSYSVLHMETREGRQVLGDFNVLFSLSIFFQAQVVYK